MGPTEIFIDAVRGGEYQDTLTIFNPNNEEINILLTATGDVADWISFYNEGKLDEPITNLTIPISSSVRIAVKFKVPMDAASDNYSSIIFAQTVPKGGQVGVGIKLRSTVNIEVSGTQKLVGIVEDISIKDTEINRPLRILVYFKNTGNVIAKPSIDVEILKNDSSISKFNYKSQGINVDMNKVEEVEWDTTGQTVGDYVANVKVYLGEQLLKEENLNFKILERGTLTASGEIVNVSSPQTIDSGGVAKIEVGFINTGKIDVNAKITGEVLNNNSELVDTVESDETLVRVGQTEILTVYFKPPHDGEYLIKGNVVYEGKKEPMQDITINVGKSRVSGMFILDTQSLLIIIFIVFAVILIIIGIFKKSKKIK
jgi:hypothetical protein